MLDLTNLLQVMPGRFNEGFEICSRGWVVGPQLDHDAVSQGSSEVDNRPGTSVASRIDEVR